jgi:HSP20 family protein
MKMAFRSLVPFSSSRSLSADPLTSLHQEMNRLFEETLHGFPLAGTSSRGLMSAPKLDIHESDNEICISAELPGVQAAELDVRLEGDVLTISGEKKNESEKKEQNYHLMERSFGRFSRSVQLPFVPQSEQVQAEFKDGVLTLHVPKQPHQERSKRIQIQSRSGEAQATQPDQPQVTQDQSQSQGAAEGMATHH